ncbi:MAG: hypothetical protein ACI974_001887, partial [Paraglaciecola sp.]
LLTWVALITSGYNVNSNSIAIINVQTPFLE